MALGRRSLMFWSALGLIASAIQGITPDSRSLASSWIARLAHHAVFDEELSAEPDQSHSISGAPGRAEAKPLVGRPCEAPTHFLTAFSARDRSRTPAPLGPATISLWRHGPSIGLMAWLCRYLC